MTTKTDPIETGRRVTVTQQIPQGGKVWTISVTGEVVRIEQKKTGSWFAHAKDDKLWLDRLTIKKDDGELVTCILDQYSRIEVLEPVAEEPSDSDESPSAEETDAEADAEAPAAEKAAD